MVPTGNKGLILDFNDEFGEFNVKSIALEHVPVFMAHPKPDVRRIRPYFLSGGKWQPMGAAEKIETLEKVLDKKKIGFRGGCLLIDDINKYVDDSEMPKDLTGMLAGNAHSDLDMIIHYQSIGRMLPKVWQNTNIIRYHSQFDSMLQSRNKLKDLLEVFQIAEIIVNDQYYNKKNKRFFLYVDRDSGKIIGNYTYQMFDAALTEYLSQNDAGLKPFLRQKNDIGKAVYTWPQAMQEAKRRLFQRYYGNDETGDEVRESRVMVAVGRKRVGKSHETARYLFEDYCGLPFVKKA
jgi:hypothetical protein